MIAGLVVVLVRPGTVLPVAVDEGTSGAATTGIVGAAEIPRELVVGSTLIVGTAAAELTPRLPISVDPSGIPVRAAPPGVVGDVDVGVEEETMLLEPEPHIPDMPDVSRMPEVVDIPDAVDVPEEADMADDDVAVAGAAVPTAIPPPSYVAVDPYIPDGEVPRVEQDVLLPGIEVVPVARGAGLTPGDAISVEPKGMPVGETVEFVVMPSGEVAPKLGVGLTIELTCALAALQAMSAGMSAEINAALTRSLRMAIHSSGLWLSDIGQVPWVWCGGLRRSAAADAQIAIQRFVQPPLPCVES
jgi:hypothetical protein